MNFSDISDTLLTLIVTYGAVVLGVVVFLAAIGVPLPSTFFVLASGAFVQQGVLDLASTFVVALACVVIGDTISYGMGRLLRRPIHARFGQSSAWQSAEQYFRAHGSKAVYLTRCVLTPIAVPTNLVAGSSGYAAERFVTFAAGGELTWLLVYGTLGYVFGSQWEAVSDFISNFSGVLVGLVIAGLGGYALLRWQRRPIEEAAPRDTEKQSGAHT